MHAPDEAHREPGRTPARQSMRHMQVTCPKCSRPLAFTDTIESVDGHLSHVDCRRPQVLTSEELGVLFLYCSDHVVAHCVGCSIRVRLSELAADALGGRTNFCPRCRQDLTEPAREHLYGCAMLPAEVRRRAQDVREAALLLVKQSQQLRDTADVLIREAEAVLLERQRALRAVVTRTTSF